MWQSGSPGFPTLLLSTRVHFPNKISCFVSTYVSSDNSFLGFRQEPSFGPWKGFPLPAAEPFNFSFFSVTGWGIDLDYRDIEWFALETNRDHPVVFETASKYCISDSFVDYDAYSSSSKGFLPTVVDIMVI